MGYPGDQQPPRQPHFPPDPRRRDLPPYGAGDDSPPRSPSRREAPYGGEQPPYGDRDQGREQGREQPLYGNREQPPYAGREPSPYSGRDQSPYAPRREAGPGGPYDPVSVPRLGEIGPDQDQENREIRREAAVPRVAPPPEPQWDPDDRGPLWRRPWVLGLALLALIGALLTGLWYAAHNEEPPPPDPGPTGRPTPLVSDRPMTKYGYAASRATDKSPLSLREVFGKAKPVNNKRVYVRTATRKEKKCADGVTGEKITKALKTAGCTQLLRASFADAKGTIIGTVGVANLRTSAMAKKVASAGAGDERKDFLKPLPGKDEATKHLGSGEASAGGWTYGHYAVLLWFQFKDGHKPTKSELKKLYQAATDIADASVYPALDTRALNGGPS
ncbi:hypothetical protein [Microbispora amethystogenes]|uniref:Uncharacterized protein n=1 Tax=Microbispora amethystogenes TaxID=1427754 RepID=A0ABQ4F7L2_9ACTN|nr:hypothetical protein [Microbispora amethystogenes]GIH30809.1 hypothetical protein Mam01_09730 [Microbispora amethystogenes]